MGTKNNPGTFDCYANAEPDEPMFILLARDPQAPHLVEQWLIDRQKTGEKQEKLIEAASCADDMRAWRKEHRPGAIEIPETESLWATAIFGHKQRQGLVQIECPRRRVVLDPVDARDFAMNVLACAEASEQDETLLSFLQNELHLDVDQAFAVLIDFRRIRQEKEDAAIITTNGTVN
jgi:hypothetical protein